MAEELNADKTPGFKVGEKKTMDEINKMGKRFGFEKEDRRTATGLKMCSASMFIVY